MSWVTELRTLGDLLSLVDRHAPMSVLKTWTPSQVAAAQKWAAASYLRASDNIVRVPTIPSHVEQLESMEAVLRRLEAKSAKPVPPAESRARSPKARGT